MDRFHQTQNCTKVMPDASIQMPASPEATGFMIRMTPNSTLAEIDPSLYVVDGWPSLAKCQLREGSDTQTELPVLGDDGKIFDDAAISLELISPQERTDDHDKGMLKHSKDLIVPRKSRSRYRPAMSTEYPRYHSLEIYKKNAPELCIGTGKNAGRNLMAVFEDMDETPRTRYRLKVERGRPLKQWPTAPPSDILLPVGLTLAQICQHYSSHVWGTGLRLFMAEGWTGEEIWQALPKQARNDKAQHRKWNYLQQAMGREADRMLEEDDHPRRLPRKRKRAGSDIDIDDDDSVGEDRPKNQLKNCQKRLLQTDDEVFNAEEFVASEQSELAPIQLGDPILSPFEFELRESERLAAESPWWANLHNTAMYSGQQNFQSSSPDSRHQAYCPQTETPMNGDAASRVEREVPSLVPRPSNVTLSQSEPDLYRSYPSGPNFRTYCGYGGYF